LNLVKKEFEQWLKLEINSTPSSVIINNKTWEFTTLSWVTNEEKLSEVIDSYLKVE
jgi:protein-disulfide isomerase